MKKQCQSGVKSHVNNAKSVKLTVISAKSEKPAQQQQSWLN